MSLALLFHYLLVRSTPRYRRCSLVHSKWQPT